MGIRGRSYRFDDDVVVELARLRAVYGTDNAAMRFALGIVPPGAIVKSHSIEMTTSSPLMTITASRVPAEKPPRRGCGRKDQSDERRT